MYPVKLVGTNVVLREFAPDDLDAVAEIVGDDRVTSSLSYDSRNRDEATAMLTGILERARHDPRTEYYLAITRSDADRMIGFARLGLAGVRAAKLGYAVHADHWRQGIATDAARTLIDFGFGELKLHRVSAAMAPDNTASIALVAGLGFQYEGRIRHHVHTNGAWRDSLLYSILDDERPRT
jgi:ribosomal-protein-alanine N-acetyltransferase